MRLINKVILILSLGVFVIPSDSYGQHSVIDSTKVKKNRISVQMGLFHYFFDNAPILNVNHREFNGKPRSGLFHQLLISSYGLNYQYNINQKNSLSVEIMMFWNLYWGNLETFPESGSNYPPKNVKARVSRRSFTTITLNYSRILELSNQFDFVYGGGINYRRGVESIIVSKNSFEDLLEGTFKNDLGLNAFSGIDYTPLKWLTLYSKLNFMGLVYLHDKEGIETLRNYDNVPDYFPSRFDLSLRFGIGFNF